ncbi:hypothetical protein TSAR_010101 [Trichomalopsis sarcophagae]|uniref:Uncharacterized protein n=1 Tax=Trichomalopsis sarcophagae TaxID=543379 RepID=A0A232FGB4_9HYME|nr:hypothetical protein TSAR_010101 [Trichomalopsis sarcophagae]
MVKSRNFSDQACSKMLAKLSSEYVSLSANIRHLGRVDTEGESCHPYKPFKCPEDNTCISIQYLCDGAPDCREGYDEDPRLCTAASELALFELCRAEERGEKALFENKLCLWVFSALVALHTLLGRGGNGRFESGSRVKTVLDWLSSC